MCTATVIPLFDSPGPAEGGGRSASGPRPCGFRLVTNRDEARNRAAGRSPRWRTLSHRHGDETRRAVFPLDPVSGGTWVAARDDGLVLCLLNVNPLTPVHLPPPDRLISRGSVIPSLLTAPCLLDAMDRVGALELHRLPPFRLIGVELAADPAACRPPRGDPWESDSGEKEHVRLHEAVWNGNGLTVGALHAATACFVSSGLGDHLVEGRKSLFRTALESRGVTPAAQDRFHHHTWPDRPEVSVMMSRRDACTVSVTTVEIVRRDGTLPAVSMAYAPTRLATQAYPCQAAARSAVATREAVASWAMGS